MTTETTPNTHLGDISKRLLPLALPMAGIQLVSVAGGFLCMTMLAKLGPTVLAASALIYSTQMSTMVIGMSILFSISILVGHANGAKNYAGIGQLVQQGWTLSLLIALPVLFFFWHIDKVLIFLGQAKPIAALVQTFFHAYMWAVPPLFLACTNQQFCYGIHLRKLPVTVSLFGVIILLLTAHWLIPTLGVAGLGYAMAAQSWFFFLVTITFFYHAPHFKQFDLFRYRVHKNWAQFVHMFKIGWPISLQISGEVSSFFVNSTLVGWLGITALGAFQVTSQYVFLIIIPIFALSQASGILVGQACGSKQFGQVKKLGHNSMRIALTISIISGLLFLLCPKLLASMYINVKLPANAQQLHLITLLFMVLAFSQLCDAVRNIMTGALRGLFDTRFPMIVGLIVIWLVGLPLSYFFAFTLHLGVIGIPLGSACGILIGAVIILYRWRKLTQAY